MPSASRLQQVQVQVQVQVKVLRCTSPIASTPELTSPSAFRLQRHAPAPGQVQVQVQGQVSRCTSPSAGP